MNSENASKKASFQITSQHENKLLVDFFLLLLEWEMEDEQKNNDQKKQKIQPPV
jgi:hypothetical protein